MKVPKLEVYNPADFHPVSHLNISLFQLEDWKEQIPGFSLASLPLYIFFNLLAVIK